jgi:hypothetical protein
MSFKPGAGQDRHVLKFFKPRDFCQLLDNQRITAGKTTIGAGTWWMKQPQRREYKGLCFEPGKEKVVDDRLNLWRGWGVEPKSGSWRLLKRHIFKVLAKRDRAFFLYIMKWTAWTLQNPGARAEVALVFKGGRGTGKGLFARALKQIFGQHGLHISDDKHLTGHFNAHLQDCALLFSDEAYWPGNKGAEGTINRIISEPTLLIEPKGINVFEVDNRIHLLMATNHDWVVPAGADERRYAINSVSDEFKQSKKYFDPLYAEMENGGIAAMMHDLLAYDLKGWHPRNDVPNTVTLQEQKMMSLAPEEEWWYALLQSGELPFEERFKGTDDRNKYPCMITGAAAYKHARETVPKLKSRSDKSLADHLLKKHGCVPPEGDVRIGGKARPWVFPPLKEARAAWDMKMSTVTEWDDPNGEWTHAGF